MRTIGPRVKTRDHHTVKPRPSTGNPAFYVTSEWRSLVARLLEQRGRRCERCGREGCRIYGDHIHELQDAGAPLDPSNVQLLCGSCHTRKTAAVRTSRMLKG